jgi:1-deoxy-D-xylulose-5-phosphate synthase
VVAIYSTFLQRAYDQLIHDVALQNLPVTFAIDRGGLVGGDGATHQGAFDLSYLRCIPNMVVMAPADENECRQMLYTAVTLDGPAAVRYPRGRAPASRWSREMTALPIGKAELRREGRSGLAMLAFGTMVAAAEALAERLDATLVNMRFVKPLDAELVIRMADRHEYLVTIEENVVAGGAGSAVVECSTSRATSGRCCNSGFLTASSSTVRGRTTWSPPASIRPGCRWPSNAGGSRHGGGPPRSRPDAPPAADTARSRSY